MPLLPAHAGSRLMCVLSLSSWSFCSPQPSSSRSSPPCASALPLHQQCLLPLYFRLPPPLLCIRELAVNQLQDNLHSHPSLGLCGPDSSPHGSTGREPANFYPVASPVPYPRDKLPRLSSWLSRRNFLSRT